ncbi:putative phosphodiesterase [Paenibacillus sp. DS2015]|uniref:purple acid phosphatase family protein n=1 Tax=Paenibacillus sp. DS2015 TaxID=3373917 RepID=UPI003D1BEA43
MSGQKGYWILGALLVLLVIVFAYIEMKQTPTNSPTTPTSLVTTFKDDPMTSRAFTWYTKRADADTVIQWIKGSNTESLQEQGVTTTKGTTTTLDIGNGIMEGVHKVNITGLKPGTTYAYKVGDGDAEGWSEPALFTTEAEDVTDFSFINVTDSQGITEQDFKLWGNTLDQAFKTFPTAQFIVHGGDLTEYPEDESAWENFFGKASPWITRYPLMPVTGNHDEVDKVADRFVSHFNVPSNGSEDTISGTSYSFDYGTAHFVFMNTESSVKDQTEWLRQDLTATDKAWVIVAMHRPAYGGNQDEKVVKRWVPLFDEFGVDLVLQGHNHEYSRSYPLKDNKIVEDGEGTVYVTPLASGQKFNDKKEDQFYQQVHFQYNKQMYAGVHIHGATLTYQAYDVDGKMLDEFILKH